jgi:hypothetical protein
VAINGIQTSRVPGVDVPLDTHAVRFDFFLAWARRMGMLGCPRVFACELHAALVCAFHLDAPPAGCDAAAGIQTVAARCRRAQQLIDTAVTRADPVHQWAAVYTALWAGHHQLGCELDQTAAPPSTPAPWGLARVEQASPGLPFPVIGWLARGEFDRAMADLHDSCPLDDWPRLHAELHTTLDSIWCLSTARMHRPHAVERRRHRGNQQRLQLLLATARQQFDPAVAWEEFRETLWHDRDTVTRAGRDPLSELNNGLTYGAYTLDYQP